MDVSASDLERFWAKVNKTSGCWEWTACKNNKGYAKFGFKGRVWYGHRWLKCVLVGEELPREQEVMHSCDNPGCVNPDHLSVGSHAQNITDAQQKGRFARTEEVKARYRGEKNPMRRYAHLRQQVSDRQRGEKHHRAKITEETAVMVIRLRADGHTHAEIGARVGLSREMIGQIVRGKAWKHLDRSSLP